MLFVCCIGPCQRRLIVCSPAIDILYNAYVHSVFVFFQDAYFVFLRL